MTKETLDSLLNAMLQSGDGISDLLFVSGKPPVTEDHGKLTEFPIDSPGSILTPQLIEEIASLIINKSERLMSDFANLGSCDCSYSLKGVARFRINIFKQNGRHAIVMRKLESQVPSLDRLKLPPVFREIIREKNGIVFITGGTGSGKTTTLAAMLNELNQTDDVHVVTLEDPIEFFHTHNRCVFSQRELGKDFPDFASGLRAALRQAPKVILVGEIRDRESMEIALSASETGHLVFTTLHTVNAGQTINRILGMFNKEDEQQSRQRLADTVRYIVSQRLVSKIGGGRLLVTEIMGSSLRTRETLLYGEGENRSFQEIIEAGTDRGWHSFDQSLLKAYEENLISEDTAIIFCTHKNKMRRDIDMLKKIRGADFEMPSGLKMQEVITAAKAPVT
jgi:twitching motility protein PilT